MGLRPYVGGEHVDYVPSIVGRTTAAVKMKDTRGEQWSEDSLLEAAQARCSEPEASLVQRLFDDVHRRGERIRWGRGATPGVSGWHRAGGKPAGVWTLSAGEEEASSPAYLYFYFPTLLDRLPVARIEEAAQHLETLPGFGDKIRDARAGGWRKRCPQIYLRDIAESEASIAAVIAAVDALIDRSAADPQSDRPEPAPEASKARHDRPRGSLLVRSKGRRVGGPAAGPARPGSRRSGAPVTRTSEESLREARTHSCQSGVRPVVVEPVGVGGFAVGVAGAGVGLFGRQWFVRHYPTAQA